MLFVYDIKIKEIEGGVGGGSGDVHRMIT